MIRLTLNHAFLRPLQSVIISYVYILYILPSLIPYIATSAFYTYSAQQPTLSDTIHSHLTESAFLQHIACFARCLASLHIGSPPKQTTVTYSLYTYPMHSSSLTCLIATIPITPNSLTSAVQIHQ